MPHLKPDSFACVFLSLLLALMAGCGAADKASPTSEGDQPAQAQGAAAVPGTPDQPAVDDATPASYDGAELYALNCANCHGVYGEGDGAVTPALSVVLLDLRYLSERNDGEFPSEFVQSIIDGREVRAAHGPSGMPIWGAEFSKSEGLDENAQRRVGEKITAITDFLRSIQISE